MLETIQRAVQTVFQTPLFETKPDENYYLVIMKGNLKTHELNSLNEYWEPHKQALEHLNRRQVTNSVGNVALIFQATPKQYTLLSMQHPETAALGWYCGSSMYTVKIPVPKQRHVVKAKSGYVPYYRVTEKLADFIHSHVDIVKRQQLDIEEYKRLAGLDYDAQKLNLYTDPIELTGKQMIELWVEQLRECEKA